MCVCCVCLSVHSALTRDRAGTFIGGENIVLGSKVENYIIMLFDACTGYSDSFHAVVVTLEWCM